MGGVDGLDPGDDDPIWDEADDIWSAYPLLLPRLALERVSLDELGGGGGGGTGGDAIEVVAACGNVNLPRFPRVT